MKRKLCHKIAVEIVQPSATSVSDKYSASLHPEIIYILEESDRLKVEIALQWCENDSSDLILSKAN